ncbi:MAG: hypothetical protein EBZ77_14360, partial [Chitinophagia bacterium]|nr:hypothetical protein [Chitinophagia bacterium]
TYITVPDRAVQAIAVNETAKRFYYLAENTAQASTPWVLGAVDITTQVNVNQFNSTVVNELPLGSNVDWRSGIIYSPASDKAYYTSGNKIYEVAADGSTSSDFYTFTGGTVHSIGMTTDAGSLFVCWTNNSSVTKISTVNLTGGSPSATDLISPSPKLFSMSGTVTEFYCCTFAGRYTRWQLGGGFTYAIPPDQTGELYHDNLSNVVVPGTQAPRTLVDGSGNVIVDAGGLPITVPGEAGPLMVAWSNAWANYIVTSSAGIASFTKRFDRDNNYAYQAFQITAGSQDFAWTTTTTTTTTSTTTTTTTTTTAAPTTTTTAGPTTTTSTTSSTTSTTVSPNIYQKYTVHVGGKSRIFTKHLGGGLFTPWLSMKLAADTGITLQIIQ